MIEAQPKTPGSAKGLEYQILDDAKHPDAKLGINGNRTCASLYDLIPASNKKMKPVGEWNHARILVKGKHVEHWLNGVKVLEFERGGKDFLAHKAESKFKDIPGFGELRTRAHSPARSWQPGVFPEHKDSNSLIIILPSAPRRGDPLIWDWRRSLMKKQPRRDFLKLAGITAAAASLPIPAILANTSPIIGKGSIPFGFGIASYTFRSFTLDQALEMTKRLDISRMTLKDMHLPMNSTVEEMKVALGKMRDAGVELSSCGVVYMKTEDEVHKAFAYAKMAGIRMMVGCPDAPLLRLVESKVRETDIALAIHNHGPTDQRYPSPRVLTDSSSIWTSAWACASTSAIRDDWVWIRLMKSLDFATGFLTSTSRTSALQDAKGSTVEIGRGVIDMIKLLKTLVKVNYSHTIHFEHEKDEKDPLPGVAESVGYVRGVLATL